MRAWIFCTASGVTILEVTVKDRDALDRYQKDSYHCGIIKPHMHAVREASVAVDVEIPDSVKD